MPSLIALTVLALAFPCYALSIQHDARDDSDFLRSLLKCQNPPYQYYPAGVMLPPPPPENFHERLKRDASPAPANPSQPIILCTPGTETYIRLTRKSTYAELDEDKTAEDQEQIAQLVGNTWTFIDREHLPPKGQDGVIDKGEGWVFERTSTHGSFKLQVANTHHIVPVPHWGGGGSRKIVGNEVTWGVLRAALMALGQYMATDSKKWGECEFEIWDGRNQVGTARIVGMEW